MDVGSGGWAGDGKIHGLAGNQAQGDPGHFEPYGIFNHLEPGLWTVDGLHAGGEFVGAGPG